MKLWEKSGTEISGLVEKFTVGRDREFDLLLAKYDVEGSLAHTAMLRSVGLITDEESDAIKNGLEQIMEEIAGGTFTLDDDAEDIHSQVELLLTRRIGEAGKKIHSGRSRNDQVAVDIKLFLRSEILRIKEQLLELFRILQEQSEKHKERLMPGYTHLQMAMPSSFGLWFGAYAESLTDDLNLLAAAYDLANKNPLGSGAGYGSSFPLDRQQTTALLQFREMHYNSVYAQMSRGKTERFTGMAISAIAATLARLSMDVCLYMNQNFGFLSIPAVFTTGSSLMPHKKNPDVFELIRAKCNRIQSVPNELALLLTNLPSGYHRDVQLTKEILFPAISDLRNCMEMACTILPDITVKDGILDDPAYKHLFTVERVNELVNNGETFRDAYRQVGNEVDSNTFVPTSTLHHTHAGSIGNLCNEEIRQMMNTVAKKFD